VPHDGVDGGYWFRLGVAAHVFEHNDWIDLDTVGYFEADEIDTAPKGS
jgi:hypothetical protein